MEHSVLNSLIPLIVLVAIFYFLIIRPRQKQEKAHRNMIESLQKGDKIITNGGIICEVIKSESDFIKVKLNEENVTANFKRFCSKED